VNGAEDPGWGYALRALIPIVGLRYRAQRAPDGLTALRNVFVGLVAALPLFLVSFSYIVEEPGPVGLAPYTVVGVGLLSTLGISILYRRTLPTESLKSLAASWRARFFIGVGFAEFPALVGLVLTLPTDTLWIYLIGMAFSLIGFWRIAPSRRNLARDQDAIRSTGSPLDLIEALMTAGPHAPGSPPRPDS
jgi:hypothetical protein